MIDLDILDRHGLKQDDIKAAFERFNLDAKPVSSQPDDPDASQHSQLCDLRNRIRNRIESGRQWNFTNYQHFHALDLAWNAPFKQLSPTLLQSLMNSDADSKEVESKLKAWGFDLSKVMEQVADPKTPGMKINKINVPAFFQIFVPLVRAYVTIRWAKILNDRRLVPFFKYEPALTTKANRLKCEVLTNRIEVMSRQMGYFAVMKQSVFQMLHYGICLQFPQEEWYTEEQMTESGSTGEGEAKEVSTVVKEGIRYHMPHPARMFWDQAHRVSTFNTDTGCEYAGYWKILRYRDIARNPNFWNTDKIGVGSSDWWNKVNTYWQTVFQGCVVNFPPHVQPTNETRDREGALSWNFYNTAEYADKTVTVTEYYEKMVPKDNGLGTYDKPIWFRFVVAGDTATIVYATPLPYAPVLAYVYDADENRDLNPSLSLEVLPFQDQFSNLLSQYLLTVQKNLTNLTMIDTDQVEADDVKRLENSGQKLYANRVFMRYSGRKAMRAQQTIPNAVYNVRFESLPTQDIVTAMRTLLDTLERVLVMSSQEVAQAATHEQTREEVKNIAANTSTRLAFTETPVDLARDAWKKQLYGGLMAYGTEEFYSYVAYDKPIDEKLLNEIGFTRIDGEDEEDRRDSRRQGLKVDRKKFRAHDRRTAPMLETFAAQRDGDERINETESAMALMQLVGQTFGTSLESAIGAEQYLDVLNMVGRRTGIFDRDFKLRLASQGDPTQGIKPEELKQAFGELESRIMGQISGELKPVFDDLSKGIQQAMQIGQQAMQGVQMVDQGSKQNAGDIRALAGTLKKIEEAVMLITDKLVPPTPSLNAPESIPAQQPVGQPAPEMAVV